MSKKELAEILEIVKDIEYEVRGQIGSRSNELIRKVVNVRIALENAVDK